MRRSVIKFLSPIQYPGDDNKTRASQYVHLIALVFMGAIAAFEIASKATSRPIDFNFFDMVMLVVFTFLLGIWMLARYGYVRLAGTLLTAILWLAVNGSASYGFGIRDASFLGNFIVLLAAGLLIGWKAALVLSGLTIVTGFGLAYAEVNKLFQPVEYFTNPYTAFQAIAVVMVVFAGLMAFLIGGLESAIIRSQANARELETSNSDLTTAQNQLKDNQAELIAANEQLKRRAERISAIAAIAKTITVVQDIEHLLPVVVESVSDRFKFHHVGVYLLEASGRSAILSASSSDEGRQSQVHGDRVKVGSESLIGFVTERGEPRSGIPSGKDSLGFEHPQAKSLLGLPLKTREIVIGALDIQSDQVDAFSREDVSMLQILADQVAIAIQNARSAERAQDALKKAEIASRQLIGKGWRQIDGASETKGYRYDGIKPEPLNEITAPLNARNSLSVPVRLRGQVIGKIKLSPADSARRLSEDEIAMVEATAERVALALESSRLLDDAQRRAQREAFLGELSSKLGASYQLDSILRDTVDELGQTLRRATVSFQLVNPTAHGNGNHPSNGTGDSQRE
jgi:GAF domain-containing protein